jgi:hypothetical protein
MSIIKKRTMRYIVILVFVCLSFSCRKNCSDYSKNIPACISAKIELLKSQPKGNPSYSVYQYSYNGQKVYYFPPQCCDQYSDLYDENCNLICHPDGGIAGGGDGTCTNFFSARTNEVLIWKDNR